MKLDTVVPKFDWPHFTGEEAKDANVSPEGACPEDEGCPNVDPADVWVNAGLPKVGRCPNVDPGTEA